jgi:hypothetical protein
MRAYYSTQLFVLMIQKVEPQESEKKNPKTLSSLDLPKKTQPSPKLEEEGNGLPSSLF